jgi:hypothetical protein
MLSTWRFLNPPKSPFFKGGLYLQFLIVPPFYKGGLGGIRMMLPSENTFGKRYKKPGGPEARLVFWGERWRRENYLCSIFGTGEVSEKGNLTGDLPIFYQVRPFWAGRQVLGIEPDADGNNAVSL